MPRALVPLLWIVLACGAPQAEPAADAEPTASEALARIHDGAHDVAVFEMGELGTIRVELLPEIAPQTVASFTKLANDGYYDGTYFHRVIPDFMVQGGDANTKNLDPRDDGTGNPGFTLPDEFSDYPHARGTLSMANSGTVDSGGSQFFITQADRFDLDGAYAAFGRVVSGMDVVDRITELKIDRYGRYGPPDRPYPVNATIERLRVIPAGEQLARAAPEAAPAPPAAPATGH